MQGAKAGNKPGIRRNQNKGKKTRNKIQSQHHEGQTQPRRISTMKTTTQNKANDHHKTEGHKRTPHTRPGAPISVATRIRLNPSPRTRQSWSQNSFKLEDPDELSLASPIRIEPCLTN
jgi:hypothetical protein